MDVQRKGRDMSLLASITLAAQLSGVPPEALMAICYQESSLRSHVIVEKDGGSASYGLCQIKLNSAREVLGGIAPKHLLDPFLNSLVAGKYLSKMIKRYNGRLDCGINAYNTGAKRTKCNNETSFTRYVTKVRGHMKSKPWRGYYERN